MQRSTGFSLIELIAVMAIMAIMASTLAPNIVVQIKHARAQSEQESLSTLATSLQHYIEQNKAIPNTNTTNWVNAVASISAISTDKIRLNATGFQRRLLVDPQFYTSTSAVFAGFTQNQGLAARPYSPRIMILSDLTQNVAAIANTPAVFEAIWQQSATATFVENKQRKIQRINLADRFVRLVLSNHDGSSPFYRLDQGNNIAIAAASGGTPATVTRFILRNTQVDLHSASAKQISYIAQSDSSASFNLVSGSWQWIK